MSSEAAGPNNNWDGKAKPREPEEDRRDPTHVALVGQINLLRFAVKQAFNVLNECQDYDSGGPLAIIILQDVLEVTK